MRLMAQRSWRKGEPLALVELPTPEPSPDAVRVSVRAIGVNPVDWKMREKGPLRLAARLLGPAPPVVVGVDFAGIVDAVGARIRLVRPGDRVVGGTDFSRRQRGSYADTVFVGEDQLCTVPGEVGLDEAGALPVAGVTAFLALAGIGRLRPGQKVLVLGASGGVGHLAVQLAKRTLQGFVVGVCSEKNAAFVRGLGADAVLDYAAGDALGQARAHAPYQIVMDCVGGHSAADCRQLLAPGGRHVIVSGESIGSVLQPLVPPFSSRPLLGRPSGARLRPLVDAMVAGQLKVHLAARFPLADAEQAHRMSRSGRVAGKIVLLP